jgi:hypothetical protein
MRLVHAAAHEQVARQRARRRMLDHLVDLELVVARAGLEEEVVREVLDEVAGRRDVVAGPRLAHRVLRQRRLAAGDELLRVARARAVALRAGEHRVDRRGDELDVAVLLGGDVRDEVVERPRALAVAEVERLERVVHEGRHLAELAAHELLDHARTLRVGVRRRRQLGLPPVDAQNHAGLLIWKSSKVGPSYPRARIANFNPRIRFEGSPDPLDGLPAMARVPRG